MLEPKYGPNPEANCTAPGKHIGVALGESFNIVQKKSLPDGVWGQAMKEGKAPGKDLIEGTPDALLSMLAGVGGERVWKKLTADISAKCGGEADAGARLPVSSSRPLRVSRVCFVLQCPPCVSLSFVFALGQGGSEICKE